VADSKKGMLADLFDGTFRTLPRTWVTAVLCGGVLFLPGALLYGWSFGRLLDLLGDLATEGDALAPLLSLGLAYLGLLAAGLVQGFATLFVRACVTEQTARVVRGETAALTDVLRHVFLHRFGKLIGQRALQYAILGVTGGVAAFILGAAIGFGRLLASPLIPVLIGVLIFVGAWVVVAWFSVRWSVTLEAVVIENVKVEESLDRSSLLVRGAWWRVFGYTILLGLMVSFAVSLIATPLVFFATIRSYARFLAGLRSGLDASDDLPALLRSLFSGMGGRFAILMYLQGIFAVVVTPVFMTLLFLGLRDRTDQPVAAPLLPPGAEPEAPAGAQASP
jgi:hypothetical protein